MESANGVSGDGGDKGGPPPPPSPLTGCYLLIVIGEPYNEQHKDIILQRIAKGLLSWDLNECLVDLEKELAVITEQSLEGEEARYGERLIQFASENLVTEILIHPAVSTLAQCMRNLLSSFTRHRHIIHAGYTFAANGSWALQDGTFSYLDFCEAFQELEVQRVVRAYENGISMDIHCAPEGDWSRLPKEPFSKACKVRVNPTDVLTSGSPALSGFVKYLSPFLIPIALENLLESSDVVGNIRFSRPTLYVFPGGQGDAALFGINGFNMLLDGGYSRKACFWDFVRHLDRLDAVLMTRLNNSNVGGISSVLRRKKQDALYPQIGHFFCNIQERKAILSPDGDKDKDPLLINLLDEGQEIISNLRHLHLNPQVCYRDSEPINLYHKVGHGTLDMYVLSPAKDSKEVREFLLKWNHSDQKLFANAKSSRDFSFPVQNLISISALLVWRPANPNDTITRILYPGSCPQNRILEGLDRLKNLEFIKHPTCSEKSLAPISTSKKTAKEAIFDKIIPKEKPATEKKENKLIENDVPVVNGIAKDKIVKKSDSTESDKSARTKKLEEQKNIENGEKPKLKPKAQKSRSDSQQRKKPSDKKSPTLSKKPIENGDSKKAIKQSPITTPAKSAKDANNRKVVESKVKKEVSKAPLAAEPKPKVEKVERKPISRRPPAKKVPISPVKKIVNGVQKPDSISRKGKLDKEATTDSSTVSTPSADQESVLKKDISKLTPEELKQMKAQELAELKEEQEAVKEIEAVFRKGEVRKDDEEALRKVKDISIDDKLETEEYLIIEKEEISLEEKDTKDENQKLARDSEESEKLRKSSKEEQELEKQEIQKQLNGTVSEPEEPSKIKEEIQSSKVTSPEEKVDISTDKKTTDKEEEEIKDVVESQPDEKVSANIKSGDTTTAPTLPEDERIPLDEIKEDNGAIEEKYVKEETKEVPTIQIVAKPFESVSKLPGVVGIRLDKQQHIRDIVKTPDEVADLPVHEEVDYEYTHELKVETPKSNDIIEKKIEHEAEPESGLTKEQVKEEEPEKDKDEDETKKMMQEELKNLTETVLKSESVLEKDILKDSEKKTSEEVTASGEEKEVELEKDKEDEGIDLDAEIEENVDATHLTQTTGVRQKRSIDYEEEAPKEGDIKVTDIITEKIDVVPPQKDSKEHTKEEIETQEDEKVDKPEKPVITPSIESTEQECLKEVKDNKDSMKKIDDKLQILKDALAEPKSITDKSEDTMEGEEISQKDRDRVEILTGTTIDKLELGRKSPKEREEDVMKIVAGVAEVLKSDAPLEEFEGKIPITTYGPYTQELRETHITTVDSPTIEMKVINTDIPTIPEEPHTAISSFLEEEKRIASIHESPPDTKLTSEDKRNSLLRESQELMMATSKMLSNIKSGKSEETEDEKSKEVESPLEDTDEEKQDEDVGTVHRMLVTASSEDGGEEIEICPPGTIIFSRSSESSGRSSPDPSHKVSKSSIVDTVSDTLSTVRQVGDLPSERDSGIDDADQEIQEKISQTSDQDLKETGEQPSKKTEEVSVSGKSSPDKDASTKSLASGKSTPDISELEKVKEKPSTDSKKDTKPKEDQGFLDKIGKKIEETLTSVEELIHPTKDDEGIKLDTEIISRIESIAKEDTGDDKTSHAKIDIADDIKDNVTAKIDVTFENLSEKLEDTITVVQDKVLKEVQDKQEAYEVNIHDSLKDSSGDFIEKKDDVDTIGKDEVALHADKKQIKTNIQEDIETSIKEKEEDMPQEIKDTKTEIETIIQETSKVKEDQILQSKEEAEDVPETTMHYLDNKKDSEEGTKHEEEQPKHEFVDQKDDLQQHSASVDGQKDVIVKDMKEQSDDIKDITIKEIHDVKDSIFDKKDDKKLDTFDQTHSIDKKKDICSITRATEEKVEEVILDKGKETQEELSSKFDIVPDKKLDIKTVEDIELESQAHGDEESIKDELTGDEILDKVEDIKLSARKEQDVKEREKREISTDNLKDKKEEDVDDGQGKTDGTTTTVEETIHVIKKVSDMSKDLEEDILEQKNELPDVPVDEIVADTKLDLLSSVKDIDETADILKAPISDTIVEVKEKKEDIMGTLQIEKDKIAEPDFEKVGVIEAISDITVSEPDKPKKDQTALHADYSVQDLKGNIVDEITNEEDSIKDIIGIKHEVAIEETKTPVIESTKYDINESITDKKEEVSVQVVKSKDQIGQMLEETKDDISTTVTDEISDLQDKVTDIIKETKEEITTLHDAEENVDSIKDKEEVTPVKDSKEQLIRDIKDDLTITDTQKQKEDIIDSIEDKKEESKEQLTHGIEDIKHDLAVSESVAIADLKDAKEVVLTSFEESKLSLSIKDDISATVSDTFTGFQDVKEDVIDNVDDKLALSTEESKEQLKVDEKDIKHVLTDSISDAITDIKDLKGDITEKIEDKKEDISKDVRESTELIIHGVRDIKDDLSTSMSDELTGLKDVKQDVIDSIKDKKDVIATSIVDSKEQLINGVEDIKHDLTTSVSDAIADIQETKEIITEISRDEKQEIETNAKKSEEQLTHYIEDIKHDLTATVSDTVNYLQHKKEDITSKVDDKREALEAIVKESKEPLTHGVKEEITSLQESKDPLTSSISDTITDLQKEKEFEAIVKESKEPLTQGVKEEITSLQESKDPLTTGISDTITDLQKEKEFEPIVKESKEPLTQGMKEEITSLQESKDPLTSSISDTISDLQIEKELEAMVKESKETLTQGVKEEITSLQESKDPLTSSISDTVTDLQKEKEFQAIVMESKEPLTQGVKEEITSLRESKDPLTSSISDTIIDLQKEKDAVIDHPEDKKQKILASGQKSKEMLIDGVKDDSILSNTDEISDLQDKRDHILGTLKDIDKEIATAIQESKDHSTESVIEIKDDSKAGVIDTLYEVRGKKEETQEATEMSEKLLIETPKDTKDNVIDISVGLPDEKNQFKDSVQDAKDEMKHATGELVGDSKERVAIEKDDILHKKDDVMDSLNDRSEEIITAVEDIVKSTKEHLLGSAKGVTTELIQKTEDIESTLVDTITDFTLKKDEIKCDLDNKKHKLETDIQETVHKIEVTGLDNVTKGKDVVEQNKTDLIEDITEIKTQTIDDVIKKKDEVTEAFEKGENQMVELDDHLHKIKDELIDEAALAKTDIKADAEKLLDAICKKTDSLQEDFEEECIENKVDQKIITEIKGAVVSMEHLEAADNKEICLSTKTDEIVESHSKDTVIEDTKHDIYEAKSILGSKTNTIPDSDDDDNAIQTKVHESTDFVEIKKETLKDADEVKADDTKKHEDDSLIDYKTISEKVKDDEVKASVDKGEYLKEAVTAAIDSTSGQKGIMETTPKEETKKQEIEFPLQGAIIKEVVDDINKKKDAQKEPMESVDEILKKMEEHEIKDITGTIHDTPKTAVDVVITTIEKDAIDDSTNKCDKIKKTEDEPVEKVLTGNETLETALEHQLIGAIASGDMKVKSLEDDKEKRDGKEFHESCKKSIDYVAESIETGIKDIFNGISESKYVVKDILKEKCGDITKEKDEVLEDLEGKKEKIENIIEEKVDETTKIKDEITENLKELKDAIHETVQKKMEDMTEIKDSLEKDIKDLKSDITLQKEELEGDIQHTVTEKLEDAKVVKDSLLRSADEVKEEFMDNKQVVEDVLSGAKDEVASTTSDVISKSEQKVHETIQTVKAESQDVLKTVDKGISDTLDSITSFGKSLFTKAEKSSEEKKSTEKDGALEDKKLTDKDEKSPSEKETMDEKRMKKEQILEEAVDDIEETFKTVVDMTESVIFDKCSKPDEDESPVDDKEVQQQEKMLEKFSENLEGTFETVEKMSHELLFEKCDSPIKKDDTDMEKMDKEKETVLEHLTDNLEETFDTVEKMSHDVIFQKCDTQLKNGDICTEKDDKEKLSLETEESKVTEKGEKETMEKEKSEPLTERHTLPKDHPGIHIPIPEKEDEKKTAELCDNKQDSLDVAGTSLEEETDEVRKRKEIQDNLLHEKQFPGGITPPTAPASPNVIDDIRLVKPSDFDTDVISEQLSRQVADKESDDEEDQYSITSQVAHSRDSSQADFEVLRSHDPMSMSFYGALPDDDTTYDLHEISKEKPHESPVDKTDSEKKEDKSSGTQVQSSADHDKKDSIESWGKPLELPAPTYLYEITKAKYSTSIHRQASEVGTDQHFLPSSSIPSVPMDMMTASFYGNLPGDDDTDPIQSWGKPLGLPSPAAPNDNKGTPKKERKLPANVSAKNKLNDDKKRAESPSKYSKNKKVNPVYVDLTYVPHHGNANYAYVDFFRKVRARYYVFSGIEPSKEVYNALLEAKQTWEDKELEVTIIPTYDTDILGYWVAENEELLTKFKIDLSPSASRCTINLQDHETSCSAYRLEF